VVVEPPETREQALVRLTLELFARPFDAEAHYQRGLLLQAGTPEQRNVAHADLTLAILLSHPRSAEAHYWRGRLEMAAGRWKEADADLTAALGGIPGQRGYLLVERGSCRLRLGRFDAAVKDVEEALPLLAGSPPWQALAYRHLAHAYLSGASKAPEPAEVVELAQKAVTLEPKSGGYWVTLAWALHNAGRHREAIEAVEQSLLLAEHPTRGLGLLVLAGSRRALGDYTQAEEAAARARSWMASARNLDAASRAEFERWLPLAGPP
jgi:tetratricopeptide (TPR) repeat protein